MHVKVPVTFLGSTETAHGSVQEQKPAGVANERWITAATPALIHATMLQRRRFVRVGRALLLDLKPMAVFADRLGGRRPSNLCRSLKPRVGDSCYGFLIYHASLFGIC